VPTQLESIFFYQFPKSLKMKRLFALMLAGIFTLLFTTASTAQDTRIDQHTVQITIPEVALLDIEPSASKNISLAPIAPTEAGSPLDFSTSTNNTLWLNYSSIIKTSTDPSRTISVAITAGTLPGGVNLKVAAAADAGSGSGTKGTPAGTLTLSGTGQNIITGIGSAWTDTPENKGHRLTYTLELATGNYADLDADDSTTLTVTYTLSDN
jgi:hypothetical protein